MVKKEQTAKKILQSIKVNLDNDETLYDLLKKRYYEQIRQIIIDKTYIWYKITTAMRATGNQGAAKAVDKLIRWDKTREGYDYWNNHHEKLCLSKHE